MTRFWTCSTTGAPVVELGLHVVVPDAWGLLHGGVGINDLESVAHGAFLLLGGEMIPIWDEDGKG